MDVVIPDIVRCCLKYKLEWTAAWHIGKDMGFESARSVFISEINPCLETNL